MACPHPPACYPWGCGLTTATGCWNSAPCWSSPFWRCCWGDGKSAATLKREITEIEQKLLDSLFRIILNDLKVAWQAVAPIEFTIHSVETEPQFLRVLAPNEAVVAVGIEIRIGDNVGMMNIAVPSIIAKMMRQKFDQQWSMRRTQSSETEQEAMLLEDVCESHGAVFMGRKLGTF